MGSHWSKSSTHIRTLGSDFFPYHEVCRGRISFQQAFISFPRFPSSRYACITVKILLVLCDLACIFPFSTLLWSLFLWHSWGSHLLQKWSVIGKLPYRIKTAMAGFWDGWLYFTSEQQDRGPDNPQPKKVVRPNWVHRVDDESAQTCLQSIPFSDCHFPSVHAENHR